MAMDLSCVYMGALHEVSDRGIGVSLVFRIHAEGI